MKLWFQYVYLFDFFAFQKDVWDVWVWLSDGRTKVQAIYERPMFFWNPFSSNTSHFARPEALREFRSFQKTCAGAVRFGERVWPGVLMVLTSLLAFTDPHGPQVINRKVEIVAISGGGFGKVSCLRFWEHFGLFGEREPHTTWAESCVFVVRFRVVFSWM